MTKRLKKAIKDHKRILQLIKDSGVKFRIGNAMQLAVAHFNYKKNEIVLSKKYVKNLRLTLRNVRRLNFVLLHEYGHSIQHKNGVLKMRDLRKPRQLMKFIKELPEIEIQADKIALKVARRLGIILNKGCAQHIEMAKKDYFEYVRKVLAPHGIYIA